VTAFWLTCIFVLFCSLIAHVLCFIFVRDNYAFVTFANYDGACAAVERKFVSFSLFF